MLRDESAAPEDSTSVMEQLAIAPDSQSAMEQSPSAPEITSVVEQSTTALHETTSVVDESKSEVNVDFEQWKENEPKKETQGQ